MQQSNIEVKKKTRIYRKMVNGFTYLYDTTARGIHCRHNLQLRITMKIPSIRTLHCGVNLPFSLSRLSCLLLQLGLDSIFLQLWSHTSESSRFTSKLQGLLLQ